MDQVWGIKGSFNWWQLFISKKPATLKRLGYTTCVVWNVYTCVTNDLYLIHNKETRHSFP